MGGWEWESGCGGGGGAVGEGRWGRQGGWTRGGHPRRALRRPHPYHDTCNTTPSPAESARFLDGEHFFSLRHLSYPTKPHAFRRERGHAHGTVRGPAKSAAEPKLSQTPHLPDGCLGFRWGGTSGLPDATPFQTNHPSAPAKPHDLPASAWACPWEMLKTLWVVRRCLQREQTPHLPDGCLGNCPKPSDSLSLSLLFMHGQTLYAHVRPIHSNPSVPP